MGEKRWLTGLHSPTPLSANVCEQAVLESLAEENIRLLLSGPWPSEEVSLASRTLDCSHCLPVFAVATRVSYKSLFTIIISLSLLYCFSSVLHFVASTTLPLVGAPSSSFVASQTPLLTSCTRTGRPPELVCCRPMQAGSRASIFDSIAAHRLDLLGGLSKTPA